MRYFLAVAKFENIHRGSESVNISPGSLSKAISRLEGELGVNLFRRDGRNIKLTEQGRLLEKRASAIVHYEESARDEISGHRGKIQAVTVGQEVLLGHFGNRVCQEIEEKHKNVSFEFQVASDKEVFKTIRQGNAHLGIVTSDVGKDLHQKKLGKATFQTCVGRGHVLYDTAKNNDRVHVDEVLKFSFVSPSHALLGKTEDRQSADGWRDDKFPRKIKYVTSSLHHMRELVESGLALAYLPDYFCQSAQVEFLTITGCPYRCVQEVSAVVRDPRETLWLNALFD